MADNTVTVRINANIEDFQKKMDQVVKKIKGAGDKVQGVADSMSNAGGSFTSALTVPLAAVGGLAIKTASDFEGAQARMQTQLGLTAQEAAKLQETAEAVWSEGFGANIDEASDAVSRIYQTMGNLPTAEMEAVTRGAFALSEAFGADIAESSRAASQLMQQFGVSGTEAMDMITKAFQSGGDFSGELLDSVSEYSTQFANMGFSAER